MPLRVAFLLFCTCFVAYALIVQGAISNSASRIALTYSLLRSGTVAIDDFAALAEDKASNGSHFYSDKAPGLSLLALPAVAVADALWRVNGEFAPLTITDGADPTRVMAPTPLFGKLLWVATIATSCLISAAAIVAFCDILLMLGIGAGASLGFAMILGFGTPVWGWSTTFFGHAAAGAFLILALWSILRATRDGRSQPSRLWHAAPAGLFLGLAAVTEFTVIPAAACLCVFALWRLFRQRASLPLMTIALAAAAAAIPLAVLALYNQAAFGSPLRLGYSSVVGFEGMKTGIFGIGVPSLEALAGIVYGGRRGILWLCPVLVFLPWAAAAAPRRQRDVVVLALAIVATLLLINAGYAYWDGGGSTGPRHIVPALGFALLPIALAYDRLPRTARLSVVGLSVVGTFVNLVAATTDMYTPIRAGGITVFTYLFPTFWRGTHSRIAAFFDYPALALAVYVAIVAALAWMTLGASRRSAPRPRIDVRQAP
jgi:hypothetical protein